MDKNTFGKLVLDNEVQLYRIAKAILKSDEDCADAAQEAITRAFEKLYTLRQDAYAKTWLIRILIHECYRILEHRSKETAFQENQSVQVPKREDYSSLYQALADLEPEFRITLVLHYLEGFQIQEIAAMLEIPEGTVKSRLYRGREKLKKRLSEEDR